MKGNFRIIFMILFIAGAGLGLLVFSGVIEVGGKKDDVGSLGTVTIWGTVSRSPVNQLLESFNNANRILTMRYVQKDANTFEKDLLEAIAVGKGPDMFFVSDEYIYAYKNKIDVIPYTSYPTSTFKASFAEAGEVFMSQDGLLTFPLAMDPLVMYYNRSILNSNDIIYPPKTWDDFEVLVPMLTVKNTDKQITKSTVSLGQFSNIMHAKGILYAMFMQAGSNIVREEGKSLKSDLASMTRNTYFDLSSALSFFISFTDPESVLYSWNKSLPNSRDFFSSEDLAFYFGFASELSYFKQKNPNQNFFVAPLPQLKDKDTKKTFAHVEGIAISSYSKNPTGAFTAATLMASGEFAEDYATMRKMVPVRRDLLLKGSEDAYQAIFYSTALYAKSLLDPSPSGTDAIFRSMVENVLSNSANPAQAILTANGKLNALFR